MGARIAGWERCGDHTLSLVAPRTAAVQWKRERNMDKAGAGAAGGGWWGLVGVSADVG